MKCQSLRRIGPKRSPQLVPSWCLRLLGGKSNPSALRMCNMCTCLNVATPLTLLLRFAKEVSSNAKYIRRLQKVARFSLFFQGDCNFNPMPQCGWREESGNKHTWNAHMMTFEAVLAKSQCWTNNMHEPSGFLSLSLSLSPSVSQQVKKQGMRVGLHNWT